MFHDNIPAQALAWHQEGHKVALATVIETWGSAPRQAGAQMAINDRMGLAGSVSGGCVEGAVAAEAFELFEAPKTKILEYGVSDSDAFAVGLACGGSIRVLLEPLGQKNGLPLEILTSLQEAQARREAIIYAHELSTGQRHIIANQSTPNLVKSAAEIIRKGRSAVVTVEDSEWFFGLYAPATRLIIIGAGHISQPLAMMALQAGYDVHIIDPRSAFATEARFPGQNLIVKWPEEALTDLTLDAHTAIACLTHDPKLDDPALMAALASDAFYIGALGSTRTASQRHKRLTESGFHEQNIARIHGPIGLPIGAQSPAEIAISILAEITQTLRNPSKAIAA